MLSSVLNPGKGNAARHPGAHPAQMAVPKQGLQLQSQFFAAVLRELRLGRRVAAVGTVVMTASGVRARGNVRAARTTITWS